MEQTAGGSSLNSELVGFCTQQEIIVCFFLHLSSKSFLVNQISTPCSQLTISPNISSSLQFPNQVLRSLPTPPEMTSLHQRINQENVRERESEVEGLHHSRWSSSSRVGVDTPPSQPLSHRQMSGEPSSSSVKESHTDPGVCDAPQRGSAVERLQHSDLKWASGSRVIADRPPLQPLSRRGSAIRKLQQSDSRWSSGSRAATFDTTSSQVLARCRMLVESSNVSALKHSVEMKNHDIFETPIRALCSFTPVTGLHCVPARSA
jgi:hypothetical protein